jgi:hypothetical protein
MVSLGESNQLASFALAGEPFCDWRVNDPSASYLMPGNISESVTKKVRDPAVYMISSTKSSTTGLSDFLHSDDCSNQQNMLEIPSWEVIA